MPPKNRAESKTKCDKSCCTDEQTTSVFLLNNDAESDELEMVKLRHPSTDNPAYFIFTKGNKKVYELFTYTESYRSYFIEDGVKSDGKLYVTTPVDPLFLVLPYLASSIHCSPLDHILRDDDFPDINRLSEYPNIEEKIVKISDKKGLDIFGFKYNEKKTLAWLEGKVQRTVVALRENSIQVSSSNTVISNNYVKHSSESQDSKDNYLKYAFGIVSEYLSSDLKQKLQDSLKITFENDLSAAKRNRSVSQDQEQHNKKSKLSVDSIDNSENSPPKTKGEVKVKTPTQSAKEKARVKAAAGSKSISSFFKKTPT